MSELTLKEPIPLKWFDELPHDDLPRKVGSTFFWVEDTGRLSDYYLKNVSGIRRPIWIMLPMIIKDNGKIHATPFCIDNNSTKKGEPWDVEVDLNTLINGERPIITISPSIHLVSCWHGFVKQGVIAQTAEQAIEWATDL